MKKILFFLLGLIAGIVVFIVLIPRIFSWEIFPPRLPDDEPPIVEAVAITNVQHILQLNTNYVEDIIVISTDSTIPHWGPLQDDHLKLWSYWEIGATIGFDLRQARVTQATDGGIWSIFINLPEPQVTDSILYDHEFVEYERIGFNESSVRELLDIHRESAYSDFLGRIRSGEVAGALTLSKTRAENLIRAFFEAAGYNEVTVNFNTARPLGGE